MIKMGKFEIIRLKGKIKLIEDYTKEELYLKLIEYKRAYKILLTGKHKCQKQVYELREKLSEKE